MAQLMLESVAPEFKHYPQGYSHWASLGLHITFGFKEFAIVVKDVDEKLLGLTGQCLTNAILAISRADSDLPLFKNRHVEGKTLIYVCRNMACRLPVETVGEASKLLEMD